MEYSAQTGSGTSRMGVCKGEEMVSLRPIVESSS